MDDQPSAADLALETPSPTVFIPPSIDTPKLLSGANYTYFSPIPEALKPSSIPVCLGVDEAGRGPVLGPMVYGVFFVPLPQSDSLLRHPDHRFDDSKVLTPGFRSSLMQTLCTPESELYKNSGWAVSSLSARDIGAHMFSPSSYNLNAQALDATVELIKGVIRRGVNVAEVYVDTVGPPATYQAKLEKIFPMAKITVAKKADSLYPCVSAASVCAKVTRDAALEVLYRERAGGEEEEAMAWGSGYPSDGRCVGWMRSNMHPVFGWGPECRFSWGTAKDMLEPTKSTPGTVKVEWPADDDGENARVTDFFVASKAGEEPVDELGSWFGTPAGVEAF
ncbi:ribonuclease HII [Coniochaeta sp. 2T2.1]|nr:ribonuclease HII [Coniochaeta sp. 2T2.1]